MALREKSYQEKSYCRKALKSPLHITPILIKLNHPNHIVRSYAHYVLSLRWVVRTTLSPIFKFRTSSIRTFLAAPFLSSRFLLCYDFCRLRMLHVGQELGHQVVGDVDAVEGDADGVQGDDQVHSLKQLHTCWATVAVLQQFARQSLKSKIRIQLREIQIHFKLGVESFGF